MPMLSDTLRQIPLFELLDAQELDALAAQLHQVTFLQGQIIFSAGEEGGEMYLIQSGSVEIFMRDQSHERITVSNLEAGEIFGEMSLLDNHPRSASAKAITDTQLIVISRQDLLTLISVHPTAGLDMLSMLGKRLRESGAMVRNRVVARNVNEEIEEEQHGFGTRLADVLTTVASDIRFTYFNAIWFTTWVVFNVGVIPGIEPFDPFPFGLLTMIMTVETIFLSLCVLISQNRQTTRDRVRNDVEYQVNIKAELEIRQLHERLDDIEGLLTRSVSPKAPRSRPHVNGQPDHDNLLSAAD